MHRVLGYGYKIIAIVGLIAKPMATLIEGHNPVMRTKMWRYQAPDIGCGG